MLSPNLAAYLGPDLPAFQAWSTPELVDALNNAPTLAAEWVLDIARLLMAARQSLRPNAPNVVLCTGNGAITVDSITINGQDGTGLAVKVGIKVTQPSLQDLIGTPSELFVAPRDPDWSSRLAWSAKSERKTVMAAIAAGIALNP
jgi:hypothetical protein